MQRYILLLRGINVGGHNKLPMQALKTLLASFGLSDVVTYIQSGNVVFRAEVAGTEALASRISESIEQANGFAPAVMIIPYQTFRQLSDDNPFPQAEHDPKSVHLYFLAKTVDSAEIDRLDQLKGETEAYKLTDGCFYLYAPDGVYKSKLARGAEKALGVETTARNWSTVSKLIALAERIGDS